MNLFIDTNIFLSFYHLSSDDLGQLRKLAALVKEKGISLLLPSQVIDEFRRNRANKIADSLRRLREQRFNIQYPQMCREYQEYTAVRNLQDEFELQFNKLLEVTEKDVAEQKLGADQVIAQLVAYADKIETTPTILEAARLRCDVGNPPGKSSGLGDALNWEALLYAAPQSEPLFFVSDDKDFSSALDEALFDPFLLDEWNAKKQAKLYFYKRLSTFLGDYYPSIKLATEAAKDLLIRQLHGSGSFAAMHSIISKLTAYADFTQAQLNEIISAYITNDQVCLIIRDLDIESFIKNLILGRMREIDPEKLNGLRGHLALPIETEEEELPF